ncbi:hypothetical protein E6C60_2717 [Paenibacillus algicola]|uniref:Uncharacterized protein n=1 Tax=Paenibacillus algicola TaxID=2565926 RepID=A0A4P8XH39_9BACL|nr:hypothetical protein E6C60_0910 [Paenibacillus algicola]QCT01665.1 hypothetical protein E6C60_0946 [Paenibacillus algicola]QCT03429.1 hypothetical protein E6C60_2717 [Paenibacillus algicola]
MRQPVMLLVLSLLHLLENLGVTGNRGNVECPVLLFDASSALSFEKGHALRLFNRLEQFAASLRRNVCSTGMNMHALPVRKAAERVVFFQDEIVGDRQKLLVAVRETRLEIRFNASFLADLIEQVGCAVKTAQKTGNWYGAALLGRGA